MPAKIDTSKPHAARMYDYLLGGKDHFAVDRETAERAIAAIPTGRTAARENRAFLGRAVRYLVAEAGIRQFLDIGTGLPSANNVHEVAQTAAPESRVVYVDNDPIVLAHARALLTSTKEGRSASSRRTCASRRRSSPTRPSPTHSTSPSRWRSCWWASCTSCRTRRTRRTR